MTTAAIGSGSLALAVERAAAELAPGHLQALAAAVENHPACTAAARYAALAAVPNARFKVHADQVCAAWEVSGAALPGAAIALALRSAFVAVAHLRGAQQVEICWTGPASFEVPVRRTREVLIDVIRSAEAELFIVSFAAYRIDAIVQELSAAADRGVDVRLVLETTEDSSGALSIDAKNAFAALRDRVSFWVWPLAKRTATTGGHASMHAKAAIADGHLALVTSANLTGTAMGDNMELGLLVRGGSVPKRLAIHFQALMATETLSQVAG